MTPRTVARPAAAGALCFAFTCAGTQTAAAQSGTDAPTASAAQEPRIGVGYRKLNLRAGKRTVVLGTVAPAAAGRRIALEVRRGRGWRTIDRDRTDAGGRYELRERLRTTGSRRARVRVAAAPGVLAGERRIGRLNVFRSTNASWYGPGLYGNRTGCGGTLRAGRLGVAHKSLRCGAMVTLKHGRRSVRVPVIDRGPYAGGREYDLTAATAQRLRFRDHGELLTTR
jgi:rare lipoprotein A